MSGECEKCHEHTLECQCKKLEKMQKEKDQFYFEGRFFDNEQEFWNYTKKWGILSLDQETADRHLNIIKKDIIMNIFLRGIEFTNQEFVSYINKIFEFSINNLPKEDLRKGKK